MSKYFQELVSEIVAQGSGQISENEALVLANQDQQHLDRYVDVLDGTVSEWASEIVKNELAARQAIEEFNYLTQGLE